MNINYYVTTYQLTEAESAALRDMVGNEQDRSDTVDYFVSAWINDIRKRCGNEIQCRAVVFREIMTIGFETRKIHPCRAVLAVAWAHCMTDYVQEAVSRRDVSIPPI